MYNIMLYVAIAYVVVSVCWLIISLIFAKELYGQHTKNTQG